MEATLPVSVPEYPRVAPEGKTLVLRTCKHDLTSRGGFRWPESGPVECPDWIDNNERGNGLHGLPWGEGDGALLDWSCDAKWLVVEVATSDLRAGGGELLRKCKFPRGIVVHCGDRKSATDFLLSRLCRSAAVVGCFLTGGHRSTLTGGHGSTLTGGDGSTLTGGDKSTLTFSFWGGNRKRLVTIYVGEDGILPGVAYRLSRNGQPEVAMDRTSRNP